jgi:hypothetical protein
VIKNMHADKVELVGPVLESGPVAEAILAAIQIANKDVIVVNRGAYLRILSPGRCRVFRADIEAVMGRPFALPGDIEQVMPSFRGILSVSEDVAEWSFDKPNAKESA